MKIKRKPKNRTSDYRPVFTNAEHKLLQNYGVGNLMDEVGVNRVMLLRTLDKMNQEMEHLSFRDHLDAMRAVSYTTGHIARLLDTRERLYQPYKEFKEQYNEYINQVDQMIEDLSIKILGQEKWEEIQLDALKQAIELDYNRSKNGS